MSIKISIITITYNSEKTIRDTLESIKSQNYKNLEYIIIDGGSTDRTMSIINEYSDVVSIMVSEKDNGISDAMNKGIKRASGELIGIIHSDDMLEKNALSALNNAWDSTTDVYYGNVTVCNESGEKTHILKSEKDLSRMPYYFCMVHPAVFVTKKCYKKNGVFNLQYKCAMDYDLLLRFYRAGATFKYLDMPLAVYRIGGTNQKLRRTTINEVCKVSIANGGNSGKAHLIKTNKIIKDLLRTAIPFKEIHNKRVQRL